MDLLEKGKQLAQSAKFDEALDALVLALENDKENADIHFYLGLCYSSLEQFPYAKYHFQLALKYNPRHPKINLVWDGIKDVEASKPPERHLTRAAQAKVRREQSASAEAAESQKTAAPLVLENPRLSKLKLTEEKWEKAFPLESPDRYEKTMPFRQKILLVVIACVFVGIALFFLLKISF